MAAGLPCNHRLKRLFTLTMKLDFGALSGSQAYQWMISMIVPRPIAWVSTIGADGRTNLAPFSFFNGITSRPPTLMFVPVTKHDGVPKDTLRNIEATKTFVVNLVSTDLAEKMNATAAPLAYGESEFEAFGVGSTPSDEVAPPRVAEARVALECALNSVVPFGGEPGVANLVFGRILCAHVSNDILNTDGRIDPARLDLIGRMGGDDYCTTRDRFTVNRPR